MKTDSRRVAVVGGLGHVGLPLSLMLAKQGFDVTIIDTDKIAMDKVARGEFPFMEDGGDELLAECYLQGWALHLTTEHKRVSACDMIILTVGTPVDKHLSPDLTFVHDAIDQIKPHLGDGQILILRSTLYPGTSEEIHESLRREGLKVGVSFCPERIAQGRALKELPEIPQIISATDAKTCERVRALFQSITPYVIELSLTEAEVAKLFSNVWRYMKFAIANQFFMIAAEKELDFYKIRDAMMFEYERAVDFPTAGFAAGPCLFKDTMQLAAYHRQSFFLGHAAMLINENLPNFIVDQIKTERTLRGVKVGILGMAFKADDDDTRESLAGKLHRLLRYEGAIVMCTDPYIRNQDYFPLEEVLKSCEVIFIGCPHSPYKSLKFSRKQRVIDIWRRLPART